MFDKNGGVGLFGGKKQEPLASKIDFGSANLFTGNGFASNNKSIFNFSGGFNIPPVTRGEEGDEDGDSDDL